MNRNDSEYKRLKKNWLSERERWGGWYACEHCGRWTQYPELDHIKRTGMGGSPERLLDTSNWQLLDRECHERKDGGLKHK